MKKRTLLLGGLLAASMANAAAKSNAEYLKEHTGPQQARVNELCLKVNTYAISLMGPVGGISSPMGLVVDSKASAFDLVILPARDTNECQEGYIKISTSAPLLSLSNAPIRL